MSPKAILLTSAAFFFLASCRPKPIDIDVPQKAGTISISSACPDAHTVYVSASYSVNSLMAILDTSHAQSNPVIPKELLIDSAIVTLRIAGSAPDTLRKTADGLYSRSNLQLQPGVQYTLAVLDCKKGVTAFANTTYQPEPAVDSMYPEQVNTGAEVVTKLHLRLQKVTSGSYYFVSYNTMRHARENAIPLPKNKYALNLFVPKQIELFTADVVNNGKLEKAITLQVKPTDTLMVQVGQVDKAYYDYLSAYKRTGALINQLTGEPINLPTNISSGLGFFSLYQPVLRIYNLNDRRQ